MFISCLSCHGCVGSVGKECNGCDVTLACPSGILSVGLSNVLQEAKFKVRSSFLLFNSKIA